jgi:hypothetical protein
VIDKWLPWLVTPALLAGIVGFVILWRTSERSRFRLVPHEETEWGTIFAIVGPWGKVYGYDRYIPAMQRCEALNKS